MTTKLTTLDSGGDLGFPVDQTKGVLGAVVVSHVDFALSVTRISHLELSCDAQFPPPFDEGEEIILRLSYLRTHERTPNISAFVASIKQRGTSFRLRLLLTELTEEESVALASFMLGIAKVGGFAHTGKRGRFREQLKDAEAIQDRIRSLVANESTGIIRSQQVPTEWHSADAVSFEPGSDYPVRWIMDEPWPAAPFTFEVRSYNSLYHIQVDDYQKVGSTMATRLPPELLRLRSRLTRRVENESIRISFQHPEIEGMRVARHSVDVSHFGLSFATDLAADRLCPGLVLPAIVVSAGTRSTLLQGVVRHVSYSPKRNTLVCGVEIECYSPFHQRLGWAHVVEPLLHPETSRGSSEDVDDVWEVYDTSGYFQLSGKQTADFTDLRDDLKDVWGHFGSTPALGCQVLWHSDRRLEATASVMLMYSGVWLFYQLARRRSSGKMFVPGRSIVRDAYIHAFEHAQWYPSLNWLMTYIEVGVHWHQLTHLPFAEVYQHTGKVLSIPFQLMEDSAREAIPNRRSCCEIGEASMEELELFIDHVRRRYPAAVVDALDWSPSKFYLENVNATLVAAGLSRQRKLYVARRNGHPVAAAVFETGSTGMHLFRLVDGVRLFAFDDDAEPELMELIEYARGWYHQEGRDIFVYFIEDWQKELAAKAGFRDLGEGRMWMIHSTLISDFVEHILRVTAPRDTAPRLSLVPGAPPHE